MLKHMQQKNQSGARGGREVSGVSPLSDVTLPFFLATELTAGSLTADSRPIGAQFKKCPSYPNVASYSVAPSFQRSCRSSATMSSIVLLSRPRISKTCNCNSASIRLLK